MKHLLKAFGLSEAELRRIAKQSAEILDTMSKLTFPNERAALEFRNRLLSAYQNRTKNEETLAARLAELDLSDAARNTRAETYGLRADKINPSLKYQDGGAAFAHLFHSVERRNEIETLLKKARADARRPKEHFNGPGNVGRPNNVDGFGQPRRIGGDIISRGYFW